LAAVLHLNTGIQVIPLAGVTCIGGWVHSEPHSSSSGSSCISTKPVYSTSSQLKDLRTYFNHILKTNYNFTSKEAGVYIGNNEVVNELHYSPYHEPTIREKMRKLPLKEALGGS